MKKNALLIVLSLFILNATFAQGDGIEFMKAPWAEVVAKAKAEEKLIFVDGYTDWCMPCKKMDKQVFTKKAAGKFYNKNFINVKINMEVGEGQLLAKKYQVRAYPAFLFVDASEKMVHRAVGYQPVQKLVELGKAAMNPDNQISTLDDKYAAGERDPDFLYNYAMAKLKAMDGMHTKIGEEYLGTQSDWGTDRNLDVIYRFTYDTDSKLFDYMVENKAAFDKKFGVQATTFKIQNLINAKIYDTKNPNAVANAEKLFKKAYPEEAPKMISQFKMGFYKESGDKELFAKTAIAHAKTFPVQGWEDLDDLAYSFYEELDEKKYLKKAVKWSKKSIAMDSNVYNHTTMAALLTKLGKAKKAKIFAEKAIEISKKSGENASEAKDLLKEMK